MNDELVFEAPAQVPPGTYPMTVLSVKDEVLATMDNPEGKRLVRWTVLIDTPEGESIQVDTLSSLNFGPRSNARKWATALLGRDPIGGPGDSFKASDLVGLGGLAVMSEKDNGYVNLTDILAPLRKTKA